MSYLSKVKQDQLSNYICGLFGVDDGAKKEELKSELSKAYEAYGITPPKNKLDYIPSGQMNLFDDDFEIGD